MKQTAMQDLREDLILTQTSVKEALLEIENKEARKVCQVVVKLTLSNIIKRIDEELLELEKHQIIDSCNQTEFEDIDGFGIHNTITKGEQYYKNKFQIYIETICTHSWIRISDSFYLKPHCGKCGINYEDNTTI